MYIIVYFYLGIDSGQYLFRQEVFDLYPDARERYLNLKRDDNILGVKFFQATDATALLVLT